MSSARRKGNVPSNARGVAQDLAELGSLRAERRAGTGSDAKAPAGRRRKAGGAQSELLESREEFGILRGLSCTITAELDLGRLARSILDQARRILGAERGVLFLGKADAAGLVPLFAVDIHGEELQEIGQVSRSVLAKAKSGELVVTGDSRADSRFSSATSLRLSQMRSIICGPLVSASGPIGVLYLDAPRAHAFLERAVEFFAAMADLAALALENATLHGELVRENAELRGQRPLASSFDRIVGAGERMGVLRRQAEIAARLDDPLLIVGEEGTGRRQLARAIHEASRRARMPFVDCDCSVLDPAHIKGVLFGRTGPAVKTHPHPEQGLVRQAEPGSLLLTGTQALDESLGAAVVLLGERGEFKPMGSRQDEKVNLRLFLSTSSGAPKHGEGHRRVGFRRLVQWYRLVIPPLRQRPEDIPVLAAQFARTALGTGMESGVVPFFTSEAIDHLTKYPWPGNVRELDHAVQRMMLASPRIPVTAATVDEVLSAQGADADRAASPWSGDIRTMREWTDEAIRQALLKTNGNKSAAARLLGVHRNTIVLRSKTL